MPTLHYHASPMLQQADSSSTSPRPTPLSVVVEFTQSSSHSSSTISSTWTRTALAQSTRQLLRPPVRQRPSTLGLLSTLRRIQSIVDRKSTRLNSSHTVISYAV